MASPSDLSAALAANSPSPATFGSEAGTGSVLATGAAVSGFSGELSAMADAGWRCAASNARDTGRSHANGTRVGVKLQKGSVGRVSRRVMRVQWGRKASCVMQLEARAMKGAVVSISFARVVLRIDVGDERKNTGANNEPQEHVKTSPNRVT